MHNVLRKKVNVTFILQITIILALPTISIIITITTIINTDNILRNKSCSWFFIHPFVSFCFVTSTQCSVNMITIIRPIQSEWFSHITAHLIFQNFHQAVFHSILAFFCFGISTFSWVIPRSKFFIFSGKTVQLTRFSFLYLHTTFFSFEIIVEHWFAFFPVFK